ncbi:MAG: hypothetical protein IH962_00555 [Chloroflexi bacterium]|nr:hypothetical protein [Chloroflexota bacterium]
MSGQQESTDQEVVESGTAGVIQGIEQSLTPLQYHHLSLMQRLIAVKNSYQTDPEFEGWLMSAINKAIYSTLRDSIEANIGDAAKELLRREQQVN